MSAEPLEAALRALGHRHEHCRIEPVSGGDIHRAWRVETDAGRIFIKDNAKPLANIFRKEAAGLEALRQAASSTGLLRVPEVLGFGDEFLALEWVDFEPNQGEQTEQMLGEGLASIHRQSAEHFGWSENNYIGSLPQDNRYIGKDDGCAQFFAKRRLQVQASQGANRFPGKVLARLDRLCQRIDEFLPLQHEAPALLHGDLWGGNWSADRQGRPWLYDPAVHFGCREAELAFTELFGGFGTAFYAAYQHHYPLDPGYRSRVDLWNLYPLLVHANLFGGSYIHRVDRILASLVG